MQLAFLWESNPKIPLLPKCKKKEKSTVTLTSMGGVALAIYILYMFVYIVCIKRPTQKHQTHSSHTNRNYAFFIHYNRNMKLFFWTQKYISNSHRRAVGKTSTEQLLTTLCPFARRPNVYSRATVGFGASSLKPQKHSV